MKIKTNIILLGATLSLLTACHDELTAPTYTVGEAVNAITLRAGISEGGEGVMTRAAYDPEANHGSHIKFTQGTALTLRVDGVWKGKANGTLSHGNITSGNVIQTTTAAIGAVVDGTDDKHNNVTFTSAQQLYWDDYGSADPANMSTTDGGDVSDGTDGRGRGLDIFAVAVNGVTTAPNVSSWTALSWTLDANQTSGWSTKDLLTSNNVKKTNVEATNNPYKFNERSAGKLLEFTHAMTKITVKLTAGEGFPGYETSPSNAKFQTAPTVKLLSFNYTGNVNVETKVSTATADTKTDINMHLAEGGASNNKATLDALVFPGNQFSATIADDTNKTPTSATNILELNADGNIYKVTAAQLVKAIVNGATGSQNGTLEQGKNYILNIIVNKTDIEVTATIKNWVDVDSEEALPKINVTATYGYAASTDDGKPHAFDKDYDLFRSTTKATGYDEDGTTNGIQYAARYTASSSSWDKTIYWPNHQTHYFFRGVYPQVGAAVSGTTALTNPEAVTTVNGNDVVAIANAAYKADTYPSDLAIAIPRKPDTNETFDETCDENKTGHTSQEGICATEGIINMNFEYAMSQVEVELKSVTGDAAVNIGSNTVVQLVNVYNRGEVKLSDGSVSVSGEKGNYTLNPVSGTGNELKRHSAIVPQALTFTEAGKDTNLRFKITVTNTDGTTDVYYADVKPIKEKDKDTLVAPNGKWESGVHYKYILTLSKTAITVTATIKDWVTVTASDIIWF